LVIIEFVPKIPVDLKILVKRVIGLRSG
jgi:hypothetical protein